MRRFAWKIQFKPLTGEGNIRLFEKYFIFGNRSLAPEHTNRLAAIGDLTAGDFKAVWDKYAFVPVAERSEEILIEELQREVAYRKGNAGQLGFAG